ncbi:MAG: hypothetical protein NTX03_13655 [Bacteroidetes bacterium]|nr:hypothetical protein [Bacteroidota bacterium]
MKNLKLLLLLCLFAKFATAQTPTWKWATKMGSLLDDYSSSTKVDKQGNVYVCGYWWSSQTLTFGTGKTALKTAKGSGQFDVYLVKYDPNGVPQWLVQGGGSYSDMARSISLDSAGNVYIGGGFNDDLLSFNASSGGTADFYGTGGSAVTITSNDSDDMFVVKVTPSGWVSWGTVLGGPNDEGVNNLSTDWAGNTYVTGYFDTVTTIGSTTLTSNAGYDGFISQIDSAGVVNWAKNFGGKGLESGYGIGVDSSGNSYIAGTFGDTLILGTDTLKSNGARKTLLIKYDIKGNLQWALGAEGNSRSYTYNLDVDKYGNSCLATRFLDTLIFRKNMTISNGSFDIGLSKFDANGKSIWVKSSGGLGNEQVSDIVVDKGGNLIVSGLLIDSLRHGSLLLKTTTTGTLDAFMVAFDSSGKPTWGVKAGGKNIDYATGVTTDNKGNYYFCGDYNRTNSPYSSTGSAVFGSITLSTVGYWDGFLAKVNACVQPKVSISNSSSLTFCSGDSVKLTANTGSGNTYQWTLGGKDIKGETKMDLWVKASGSYGVRVDNITGCQANATAVTVSVLSKPTATIVAKSTAICSGDSMVLIAPSGSGLTYKWLYNGSAIGGATGVNFYASKAGNYRVIVSNSVCPAGKIAAFLKTIQCPTM